MDRITNKMLEIGVERLNELTNNNIKSWDKNEDGKFSANIGTYEIDGAYGGVRLVQIASKGGAVEVISNGGFGTKRELYNQIHTLLRVIENKGEK